MAMATNNEQRPSYTGVMFLFGLLGFVGGGAGGATGGALIARSMGQGADGQFLGGMVFALMGAVICTAITVGVLSCILYPRQSYAAENKDLTPMGR